MQFDFPGAGELTKVNDLPIIPVGDRLMIQLEYAGADTLDDFRIDAAAEHNATMQELLKASDLTWTDDAALLAAGIKFAAWTTGDTPIGQGGVIRFNVLAVDHGAFDLYLDGDACTVYVRGL